MGVTDIERMRIFILLLVSFSVLSIKYEFQKFSSLSSISFIHLCYVGIIRWVDHVEIAIFFPVFQHLGTMKISELSQFEGSYDVLCDDVIRTKVTMKEILEVWICALSSNHFQFVSSSTNLKKVPSVLQLV